MFTHRERRAIGRTISMTSGTYPHRQTGHIYDITDNYDADDSRHFTYDRWYRLSGFEVSAVRDAQQPSRKLEWTFDNYGNILTRSHYDPNNCQAPSYMCTASYSVDASTNRLTSINRITWEYYSWDAAGNMTSKGTFDAENRVTSANGDYFFYDGNSRRLSKIHGSTKLYYIYSATGQLMLEYDWTATASTNQIYFNGQLIATHDSQDYVRFLFKDHLGSTRSVVRVTPGITPWEESWETTEAFDYDPYGTIAHHSVQNGDTATPPHRFTGKERDETGLDYFGARYYEASNGPAGSGAGRWISADSASSYPYEPALLNKYIYCRNDPINLVDPDGHDPICWQVLFRRPIVYNNESKSWMFIDIPLGEQCINPFSKPTKKSDAAGSRRGTNVNWIDRWNELSADCQEGLETAMSTKGSSAATAAMLRLQAISRALAAKEILTTAGSAHNIDWTILAAIGIRETAFESVPEIEAGKGGRGTLQIDIIKNPTVSEDNAMESDLGRLLG